jgi:hypothetical protein
MFMDPENIIKGRIAEAIIEELLRSCGNKVYRFGYESTIQNLIQTPSEFDRKTKNGQRVSTMPDFIVINADGSPFFVEVKFRSDPHNLKGYALRNIKKLWYAKVVLVTIAAPYFRIARPHSFSQAKCLFEPLESDQDLNVGREYLQRFQPLVDRFLINRTGGQREADLNSLHR